MAGSAVSGPRPGCAVLTGGVVSGVVLGAGAIGTKVATKLGAVDNRPGARAEGEKQSVRSPQQAMAIGWR